MNAHCLSRVVLSRIADKWTALIIHVLATGTRRYAALQREIGGMQRGGDVADVLGLPVVDGDGSDGGDEAAG